jgi:hypothetical protein
MSPRRRTSLTTAVGGFKHREIQILEKRRGLASHKKHAIVGPVGSHDPYRVRGRQPIRCVALTNW